MSNPLRKVKLNKIFYFYYLFFKPNLKKVFYNFVLFVLCLQWFSNNRVLILFCAPHFSGGCI